MAHGLPDYYRGVDVAYQALSEMIVRPKYGAAQSASGSTVVLASSESPILGVFGKGMIYGGGVIIDESQTQKNDYPVLYIDGTARPARSFYDLNLYGIDKLHSMPFYLLKYDDAGFIYTAALSSDYTFEVGFNLKYDENHGNNPTVHYWVMYALI